MYFYKNGKLVEFDEKKHNNDKEKYTKMWKEKYNVELPKENTISVEQVVNYISGKKFYL